MPARNLLATNHHRSFAAQRKRNHSGIQPREFDYYFESKMDYGRFPYNHQSYMKVLGDSYDTSSP